MEGGNFRPKSTPAQQPKRDHIWQVPAPVAAVLAVLAVLHFLPGWIISDWEARRLAEFAFTPIRFLHSNAINQRPGAEFYTMLTHGFLHLDSDHLIMNSAWLLVFGTPVARVLGRAKFLVLFAFSIVAGAGASLVFDWGQFVLLIGASGGVSGLTAACIPIIYSKDKRALSHTDRTLQNFQFLPASQLLNGFEPIFFSCVWIVLNLSSGAAQFIVPTAFLSESRIAWEAHLGGFLAGLAMLYLLAPRTISRR